MTVYRAYYHDGGRPTPRPASGELRTVSGQRIKSALIVANTMQEAMTKMSAYMEEHNIIKLTALKEDDEQPIIIT